MEILVGVSAEIVILYFPSTSHKLYSLSQLTRILKVEDRVSRPPTPKQVNL
jgi:hypothetical protein